MCLIASTNSSTIFSPKHPLSLISLSLSLSLSLSFFQIEALSAEGEPSEEQQQVLNGLQDRVNQAIELYGEDGAMVRIGGRLAT